MYMHVLICIWPVFTCIRLYLFYNALSSLYSLAVSLGCTYDEVRSDPGSWLVVGMIPIYNHKAAARAGRPRDGPAGCTRRKLHLFHQCYGTLLAAWNTITANVKILQWADGVWRKSLILMGALLGDQPEADAFCGSGPQTCKVCTCPKSRLCDTDTFPLRKASQIRKAVHRAADGKLRADGKALFERNRDHDVAWKATRICSRNAYENTRKLLGGYHLLDNAFLGKRFFNVQVQVCIYLY